ncbi:MAG: SPFH domain-containing protein [Pseudomonadota bacterium]
MGPPPPTGWMRFGYALILLSVLGGVGVGAWGVLAPDSSWPAQFIPLSALGLLAIAAWGPHLLTWSHKRRLMRLGAASPDMTQYRWHSHWCQMAMVLLSAIGAVLSWLLAWPKAQADGGLVWFGMVALIAFPALVVGNALAQHPDPACRQLARFARFATVSLLVIGLATATQGAALPVDIVAGDAPLSVWALRIVGVMHIALAIEWIIRSVASPFLPLRSAERLTASLILDLVAGRQVGTGGSFEDQFGIDLSQSWAVHFVRTSSVWLVIFLSVATWATTAVTTLRVDERGLYQRLGKIAPTPLEPGLHAHLPWPFGSVRRISYGGIEEVRLNAAFDTAPARVTDVEAPSTQHDDRIWSKNHGEELFLMIANQPRLNSGESYESQRHYELYHADVVVTFRVGLDPAASLRGTYHVADAVKLVSQIGRRELIELFNDRTAEDLLFADFSEFSQSHHGAVQRRLDALQTGIDVVDVIFEAVHPPIDTAATFERVHAAEKESSVQVNIARAAAEQIRATSQINAARSNDEARADAFSETANARAEREVFAAERIALQDHAEIFAFERALQAFERTFAEKNLIIIDPEIEADQGFVVDLTDGALSTPVQE